MKSHYFNNEDWELACQRITQVPNNRFTSDTGPPTLEEQRMSWLAEWAVVRELENVGPTEWHGRSSVNLSPIDIIFASHRIDVKNTGNPRSHRLIFPYKKTEKLRAGGVDVFVATRSLITPFFRIVDVVGAVSFETFLQNHVVANGQEGLFPGTMYMEWEDLPIKDIARWGVENGTHSHDQT